MSSSPESQDDFPHINNIIANTDDFDARDLLLSFKRLYRQWRSSPCRSKLIQNLTLSRPANGWKITKALCFALGSLSDDSVARPEQSLFQLAVFLDIVSTALEPDCAQPIRIVLQDPDFSATALLFFSALNLHASKSENDAQELISDKTFTFAPWLPLEYELVARHPGYQPSLHIGMRFKIMEWKLNEVAVGNIYKDDGLMLKRRNMEHDDPSKRLDLLEIFGATHDEIDICKCNSGQGGCDVVSGEASYSPLMHLAMHVEK